MFHIIPFAVGVVTGAVILKLFKSDKTQEGLEKAQGGLRGATVSSLQAIENASARARARLATKEEASEAPPSQPPHLSEEDATTARAAAEAAKGAQGAAGGGKHHHRTASESLQNTEDKNGDRSS